MSLLDEMNALLDQGRQALEAATDPDHLEAVRVEYLGRQGKLRGLMGRIKEVAAEQRGTIGQAMNKVKEELESALETRKAGVAATAAPSGPLPDPTLPGVHQPRGTRHPLTQVTDRIIEIFTRLGFSFADGPEIEDEFHNYEALNVPEEHPARDEQDVFLAPGGWMLRSHTSPVQIRAMEASAPPVRVLCPGRVYRPDTVDATHHYAFHQIEGLAVDEGITMADLRGVLGVFARELFGEATQIRLRPSFFPFTEPSAEMDVTCPFCGGSGCRICKQSGWIEILGCGMVDPNVFEAVQYDAERYTGFAFGMGVERVAMLTLQVDDIRRFLECDLRFLRQF